MSEPKLISPMLDNYTMGDPISDHNGVRCCPAIQNDTEDKYIVKIISSPASQTQLEALLLSGAYADKAAAASYYRELTDGIVHETETLQKLSALEGFVAFDAWQVEPMDGDETGFDVYLLSTYRNTLRHSFRKGTMTHLGAINLGLDLCAALTVCRRSGYLYVNLKPDNIYVTGDNEYRIGDLGFVKLDSLKYASLPDRYRSQYTAPEVSDAFSALNTTMDVYAVGLILYQAFNDGALPFRDANAPEEAFPAPAYADYEMAEIILKACAPTPEMRWQDPIEMGQALVSYMQRNGANDTLIAPVVETETASEPETEIVGMYEESDAQIVVSDTEIPEAEETIEEAVIEDISEEDIYAEDGDGNLIFISEDADDETAPDDTDSDIDYEEVTAEVSDMLLQADDLIAHQTPDPVVQPEPIDVPVPEPIQIVEEEADSSESVVDEDISEDFALDEEVDDMPIDEDEDQDDTPSKTRKHWLRNTILILTAVAILAAGFLFYRNFYLQPIDSIVLKDIDEGTLTVLVTSQIDESKLTVVCLDTYGNQIPAPVVNGKATFTNLTPNSAYTVKVQIDGFHRLTGDTTTQFTTPAQTNIVQFNAVTGTEDGSAILSFTIDGPDTNQWKVVYNSANEAKKEVTFSGHMVTVTGLTVGEAYNFELLPEKNLNIIGTNKITHTASKIIKPVDLTITGCLNNKLTAAWSAPADTAVQSWTVRCYNDKGFDKTVTVQTTSVEFDGVDPASDYTIEVAAAGMSIGDRAYAAANSLTVTDFKIEPTGTNLTISWNANDAVPENGWLLMYTVDGSAAQELTCKPGDAATLSNFVPGATYKFTLQTAEGGSVLGGTLTYRTDDAKDFSGYGVKAKHMTFKMCKTPSVKKWDRHDLKKSDYKTEFSVDEKASFLVHLDHKYSTSKDKIVTLFVIRDENGNIISTATQSAKWKSMWYKRYCELDIPAIPQAPGKYTISIYFNGQHANTQSFTVTA